MRRSAKASPATDRRLTLKTTAGIPVISSRTATPKSCSTSSRRTRNGVSTPPTDNLHMLTLNRGGPVIWLSEKTTREAGIVDNDWVELFNVARSPRARGSEPAHESGMTLMYHAQEKIVNTPDRRSPVSVAAFTTRSPASC